MQLAIGQSTEARDLAQALEGNNGTFVCRQGAQVFTVVAEEGHSIKAAQRPSDLRYWE